jgi:hypothetical protein
MAEHEVTLTESQLAVLTIAAEKCGEPHVYAEAFVAGYLAAAGRRELPPLNERFPVREALAGGVQAMMARLHAQRRAAVGEALADLLWSASGSRATWPDNASGFRCSVGVKPRDPSREPSMSHNPPVLEVMVGFAGHKHTFETALPDTDSMYEAFGPPTPLAHRLTKEQ